MTEIAFALEAEAEAAGIELLVDDRTETPGVKFADAELLGAPWMITISPRSLEAGGAEVTRRSTGERNVLPIGTVLDAIRAAQASDRAAVEAELLARGYPPRHAARDPHPAV